MCPPLHPRSLLQHRLHRSCLHVGAQVRVSLRHLDGLVAHEALNRVQGRALDREPGGEGVAQGVEDHAVLGVGGGVVEADGIDGALVGVGNGAVGLVERVGEDQACGGAELAAKPLEHGQGRALDLRVTVGAAFAVADQCGLVGEVDVLPLQMGDLAETKA